MKDLNTGNLWLWERGKFMNRRYMMQEMYQQFLDEDDAWKKVAKDQVRQFFRPLVQISLPQPLYLVMQCDLR